MRRALLLLLTASLLLLACSRGEPPLPERVAAAEPPEPAVLPAETPSPAPPVARFSFPPQKTLALTIGPGRDALRLGLDLRADLLGLGYAVEMVAPGGPTDLYVGHEPPAAFQTWPLSETRFVPVVPFWLPITGVTALDLERLLRGQVQDWAEVGALSSQPVVPLLPQTDPPSPFAVPAGRSLSDPVALSQALAANPGGIALIPREWVDPSMRTLWVDGQDPLLEEVPLLLRRLVLAWSPEVPEVAVEAVQALGRRQSLRPIPPMIAIAMAGDLQPGRAVRRESQARGENWPFQRIAPLLRRADLAVANLEGALSDNIPPPADPMTFYFVGTGGFVRALSSAGVDAVSLANNHSMNFGRAGLSDTLALLEAGGIVPFGAGMDLEQALRPALLEVRGVTFAFLGYDGVSHELYGAGPGRPGTAPAFPDLVAAGIAAAREQADVVIPYFHWGWEYTRFPSPWQERMAHLAVEAGADLVLGSHPHWVQGLERYQETPILYSLGNCVFDQMWSVETRQGLIVTLVFGGDRLVNVRLQAIQVEQGYQPAPLPAAQAQEAYQTVRMASPNWP